MSNFSGSHHSRTPSKLLADRVKIRHFIGVLFHFYPLKNSYFNTPDFNCQNNNALGKTAILTFIREQQIFSWKICACRARIIMQNLNKCAFCPIF